MVDNAKDEFLKLLDKTPQLKQLFDLENFWMEPDAIERYLSTASHGEVVLAKFVLGMFSRRKEYQFDLVNDAAVLDVNQRKIIMEWLRDPFWP